MNIKLKSGDLFSFTTSKKINMTNPSCQQREIRHEWIFHPYRKKLLHYGYFKEEHMSELKDYEKDLLKSYLKLPVRKLLNHEFEIEEAQLAGYVQRFFKR